MNNIKIPFSKDILDSHDMKMIRFRIVIDRFQKTVNDFTDTLRWEYEKS